MSVVAANESMPRRLSRYAKYARVGLRAYRTARGMYNAYNRVFKRKNAKRNYYRARRPGRGRQSIAIDARSGRPRVPLRKRRYRSRKVPLSKRVKLLEDKAADNNDRVIVRNHNEAQLEHAQAGCVYAVAVAGIKSQLTNVDGLVQGRQIDSAVTAQVAYDPSVLDQATGFKTLQSWEFRNNGNIACKLDVWYYDCIKDTNDSPFDIQEDVMEAYGVTNFATAYRWDMYCPYDSNLKNFWRKKKRESYVLNAGDTVILRQASKYHRCNNIEWTDRPSTYLGGITRAIVVRQSGVVSHDDTTTDDVGWSNGKLDYVIKEQINFDTSGTGVKVLTTSAGVDGLITPVTAGPTVGEIKESV